MLDPRIKAAVDAAITEGRVSIDELVVLIRGAGGDASRSAVGRYRRGFEESLTRYREAQAVAGRWVAQFQADPAGDVGRLLAEMVKTLAFQTMAEANEEDCTLDPKSLGFLARAVKDLAAVDKTKAELEARVRGEMKAEIEKKLAQVESDAAQQPMTPAQALERVRALYRGEG